MTAISHAEALSMNVDAVVEGLDVIAHLASEVTEPEDAVRLLAVHADLRKVLDQVKTCGERVLLAALEAGESVRVPGAGQAQVRWSGKQRTQGGKLARTLAARIADTAYDPATGEKVPPAVLCERTADELVEVFALGNASATFRSGEVESRGLKPGDFRSFEDGSPKVTFERLS